MVDSSVWMEIVEGTEKGERARDFLVPRDPITTVISIAEVERALIRKGWKDKLEFIDAVMDRCAADITKEIAKKAALLSIEKGLGLADAIIAAASLLNKCTLYTADKDFKGKGLDVIILE